MEMHEDELFSLGKRDDEELGQQDSSGEDKMVRFRLPFKTSYQDFFCGLDVLLETKRKTPGVWAGH